MCISCFLTEWVHSQTAHTNVFIPPPLPTNSQTQAILHFFLSPVFPYLKQERTNLCGVLASMLQGERKDINKHQTTMRFTCLIINFLQVLTFQQGPVLERRREREIERGTRAQGTRAEGGMSARNTSSALPNTKPGLSLVFLYPPILFPLLEELGVQDFRGGCNEHIKARRQIVAQRTHSKWALISLLKM